MKQKKQFTQMICMIQTILWLVEQKLPLNKTP